jgi:nicotinamide riboside transporter PnuC
VAVKPERKELAVKLFGREPALWAAFLTSAIAMFSAFVLPLDAGQQAVLNALVAAILGLITAVVLKTDGISAAVLGLVKAALAVGIGFGLAVDPTTQAVVMTFAAAATGMFIRTQEAAPVPAVVREPREPHVV